VNVAANERCWPQLKRRHRRRGRVRPEINDGSTHEALMAVRGLYYEMVLRLAESAGKSIEAVLR